jgi:hypothetical protein
VVGSIPPAAPHPVPLPPVPQPPVPQPPAAPAAAFGTGSDGQPAGPRWQRSWLASAAGGEPAADETLPPPGLPPAAPRQPGQGQPQHGQPAHGQPAHGRPVRRPAPGGRVVPPPVGQDRAE